MECLNGNGAQPVPLLSPKQQAVHRQAAEGDGGGGRWGPADPADDHIPGPAVDRESEDTRVQSPEAVCFFLWQFKSIFIQLLITCL